MNQEIKADKDKVEGLTKFIMEQFDTYCQTNQIGLLEAFMAAHNVHKQVVTNIAVHWMPGIPLAKTCSMADLTFRRAMRDMRLGKAESNGKISPN
jgi:hypothetical protein